MRYKDTDYFRANVRFCPFSYNKYRAKGFLRMLNYLNAKTIFENVSAIRLKRQGVV